MRRTRKSIETLSYGVGLFLFGCAPAFASNGFIDLSNGGAGFFCKDFFSESASADERLFSAYTQALEAYRIQLPTERFTSVLNSALKRNSLYDFPGMETSAAASSSFLAKVGKASRQYGSEFDLRVENYLRDLAETGNAGGRTIEGSVRAAENVEFAKVFRGHSGTVLDIRTDAKFERAVTASWDGRLIVWNLKTAEKIHELIGHEGQVNTVEVNRDFTRALTASADHTVRLWNLETGELIHTFQGHYGGNVMKIRVNADFTRAMSSATSGPVLMWNLETLKKIGEFRDRSGDNIDDIRVSADWQTLLTIGYGPRVNVWNIADRSKKTWTIHEKYLSPEVEVNREFTRAITASYDGTLKVFDIQTGHIERTLVGHTDGVTAVQVNEDFTRALSRSNDGSAIFWNLDTGERLGTLSDGGSYFGPLTIGADWKTAINRLAGGRVAEWSLETFKPLQIVEPNLDLMAWPFVVSPDRRRIFSASTDFGVWLLDLEGVRRAN